MDTEGFEPAAPWHAFDRRRPPHARPDKRPTRVELHNLARAAAQHGVHAGLDKEDEMGVGTQAAIHHEHIPGRSSRVHLVHLGQIVGHEGCDHQLQQ
jgi:hypothetical protein